MMLLKNLDDITPALPEIPPIVFINHDINYGVGLDAILPNFHIAASGKNNVNFLVPNLFFTPDYKKTSFDLLADCKTIEYISKIKNPNLIFFKANSQYFNFCDEQGWKVLNNPPALSLGLENKLNFPPMMDQLSVRYPKTVFIRLQEGVGDELQRELGENYVIQFARGFGGNKTFGINKKEDLDELIDAYRGRRVKATQFIDGWPLTINACVTSSGILASYPFHQITGVESLTKSPLGACGNDWGEISIAEKTIRGIIRITEKIGQLMQSKGYKGIFGVDFVVEFESEKIFAIEINPRLIASMPIFTQFQLENREIPMLLIHCLEFLGMDYQFDIDYINEQLQRPRSISQLILHNLCSKNKEILDFPSGIYQDNILIRSGNRLEYLQEPQEYLLITQQGDHEVSENGEISRIFIKDNALDMEGKLKKKFDKLIRQVYQTQLGKKY